MKDWCCERNGVGCNCDYNPDMTPEENRMADAIMRENVLNKEDCNEGLQNLQVSCW